MKGSGVKEYGWGWEALRLWTARHDNYLGDRSVDEDTVKNEMALGLSIRKTLWEMMGVMPAEAVAQYNS